MSKEIGFHIKEDTITDYLNLITSKVESQSIDHLYDMGRLLTTEISKNITKWNDNLRQSGMDESRWVGRYSDGEYYSLTVEYTGVTPKSYAPNFMVWWEFAEEYGGKYIKNPANRTLGRDYAYFQETGIDPIVKPDIPRNNLNYVERGVEARHKTIINKSAGYIKNIMYGNR